MTEAERIPALPVRWPTSGVEMQITEVAHGLELSKATVGYVRSPGLHMSDIYGALYKKLMPKRYDKRDADGNPLPFSKVHAEFGTAFEESLEEALEKRLLGERPGEFRTLHAKNCPHRRTKLPANVTCWCGGGIYYSPDYLFFEADGLVRLGEFKATWMSSKHGIRDAKFDKWFCQMKAYCYHLETVHAILYPFFVVGDYTDKQPKFDVAYKIEFTERELTENWDMLLKFARKHGMLTAA